MSAPEQPDSKQQQFLALGGEPPHYALLGEDAVALWKALESWNRDMWKAAQTDVERERCLRISGCLAKLGNCLRQVARLRVHHDDLMEVAVGVPTIGHTAAFDGAEACGDFEGLLLHGRAALDRLTWFLSSEFKNQTSSYRSLLPILANFAGDDRAVALSEILRESDPWVDALYAKLQSSEALRDIVGHKQSILEGVCACFAVNRVDGGAYVFDCELRLAGLPKTIPILETARNSSRYLSFIVLNSIAAIAGVRGLPLTGFEPRWINKSVVFSRYVIVGTEGSPLYAPWLTIVRRMTPDGFELTTANMESELASLIVPCPPVSDEQVAAAMLKIVRLAGGTSMTGDG